MDKKPYAEEEVEKLVRQHLQQHEDSPDDGLWAQIASRQQPLNTALRLRYWLPRMAVLLGVVATVGLIAWHARQQPSRVQQTSPLLAAPAAPAPVAEHNVESIFAPQKPPAGHLPRGQNSSAYPAGAQWLSRPATRLRFAAEDGFRYENPATGTQVHIPAQVLTYADGRPVSGEVEFELREFRQPTEFIGSGIPMHYADARGEYFFNSGGMFDVRVSQQGEALQLLPGQHCEVKFRPTHTLTQASLFYFEEARQAWVWQPDPAIGDTGAGDGPPVVTEAIAVRDNLGIPASVGCLPPVAATLPPRGAEATWIQDALQTWHDVAYGQVSVPGWFKHNPHFTNNQFLNGLERGLVRLVRHRDAQDNFFPEDLKGVFTELQAFRHCYFICPDSLNRQSLSEADLQAYWDRVSVVQDRGAVCYVSFFGKQGLLQFYATLVGSTGNDDFDVHEVMANYRRLQEERRQNTEREINRWRQFLAVSAMFQTQQEWCLSRTAWLDYVEQNPAAMRARYQEMVKKGLTQQPSVATQAWAEWRERVRDVRIGMAEQNGYQKGEGKRRSGLEYALQVTRFGLHNYDQIFRLSTQPQYLLATYKTSDGHTIRPASVAVLDRLTKLFFTLPDHKRLLYVPGRQLDIVITDEAGRAYWLSGEVYARLQAEGRPACVLSVEDVTERTRTPQQWARLLDI